MKKLIALMLALLMLGLSLTSCIRENTKDEPVLYTWGNEGRGWPRYQDLNALLTSETKEFDLYDVTLDFYYCFYCLDDKTIEEARDHFNYETKKGYYQIEFAVYLSNNGRLDFETGDDYRVLDFENKVNAKLYKYITYEEAFTRNYGYTTYGISTINYNHSEKLTIPAEFFNPSNAKMYIYVVMFANYIDNEILLLEGQTCIDIKFELLDNNRVVLIEN